MCLLSRRAPATAVCPALHLVGSCSFWLHQGRLWLKRERYTHLSQQCGSGSEGLALPLFTCCCWPPKTTSVFSLELATWLSVSKRFQGTHLLLSRSHSLWSTGRENIARTSFEHILLCFFRAVFWGSKRPKLEFICMAYPPPCCRRHAPKRTAVGRSHCDFLCTNEIVS